jgi:hypothetical protein
MVWWTSVKLATKLAVGGEPEGITLTEKLALALAYAKPQIRTKKRPAAAAAMPTLNRLWLAAPRAVGHGRVVLASAGSAFINVIGHLGTADAVQYRDSNIVRKLINFLRTASNLLCLKNKPRNRYFHGP